uniref:Glutaminyl-tRNA synthetase class Ib non-specific RNA-binding domain-containing protein n=1 Tax=Paramormyrops kingsleyae TaxID=1676925 RepID=A0A3B3SK42_9TELE
MADMLTLFASIGLSDQKAKETLKNESLSVALKQAISRAQEILGPAGVDKAMGTLLYSMASRLKDAHHLRFLTEQIVHRKITTDLQLSAALDFLKNHSQGAVVQEDFDAACGVGVVITPEQIEDAVEVVINKHKDQLLKERYRFNMGLLMVAQQLPAVFRLGGCSEVLFNTMELIRHLQKYKKEEHCKILLRCRMHRRLLNLYVHLNIKILDQNQQILVSNGLDQGT